MTDQTIDLLLFIFFVILVLLVIALSSILLGVEPGVGSGPGCWLRMVCRFIGHDNSCTEAEARYLEGPPSCRRCGLDVR